MSNEYGLPHKDKDMINRINISNHKLVEKLEKQYDLSFKAVGILFYLKHKHSEWMFNEKDLYNLFSEGKTAVRSGLKELKDSGILKETKWSSADKQGTHWVLRIE